LINIKSCADVMRLNSTVDVGTHLEIIIYTNTAGKHGAI